MDKPKSTFRGFVTSSTCKALARINGQEHEVWLLFRPGYNWDTIADTVGLVNKDGLYHEFPTDEVEYVDILAWEEPPDHRGRSNFGEIPVADTP